MKVCYDAERMTLSCAQFSTTLSSNEGDMLLALMEGNTDKEALISQVWGGRGLVVSDSSYYKTVHGLRSRLVDVGLSRDSLKTLPKRGLILLCEITLVSGEAAIERKASLHLELQKDRPGEPIESNENSITNNSRLNDLNIPASDHMDPTEDKKVSVIGSSESRDGLLRRNYHLFLPSLAFLGALLPLIYAYLIFNKPPDLEEWKRVWKGENATLYAEYSESMSKDDIMKAMTGFEPPLILKDTNYYVRKPLSQLLVSCVKPESHGEALCVNYLRVGKK
ncbi:winged helix-turn-helix domain-containing protein [Pseudomonas faucium]|uniref:winged helix-turn-helix domain-containing protein n=1 Tax=Pseudomonas faucium TaxID=2740518 RepID=UPI001596BC8B|nr:DNA-binding protein [Pseudomonas faucium]